MTIEQRKTPTIGVIGAGRVGTALAVSLANLGYSVVAVASRTSEHAVALAERINSTAAAPEIVIELADLTLLAVSDDGIESAASAAAEKLTAPLSAPKAIVHTSGIHTHEMLAALSPRGLMTGSLHPALPVAASLTHDQFQGAAFALEADQPLLFDWLEQIVSTVGARAFRLGQDQKALYHTALVMASNYTVSLHAFAEHLLTTVGLSKADADDILGALLQATVDNLQHQGVPDALTGPLVRGDTGTLRRHLQALHQVAPEGVKAYRTLARLTYPLLSARGVSLDSIERLFQEDESSWPE